MTPPEWAYAPTASRYSGSAATDSGVLSALQIENDRLRFVCVTSDPKLKSFKRLPGLEQRRRFSTPESVAALPEYRLAVGA